jgi:hypothetical protein
MRGRVQDGVIHPEKTLPEGTEVEITPLRGNVVTGSDELERHWKNLEDSGELEPPEFPTHLPLQPLVEQPIPGALEQFLEDRRFSSELASARSHRSWLNWNAAQIAQELAPWPSLTRPR